jgi:glycosyltransferase involved in cell wall biosynthesis
MIPTKRIEVGIKAVSQIANAHLVVAGDGPSRQALEAEAAHLLPGRFTAFTVPWMQMPHLYRSADVFLHLSKEEAFGNVFIEAMASGLPVVGHETPRFRWIVGDHGLLLDTDDPFAVARKIEIAKATARERRTERIELAATFSWKKMAQMYRRFMQDVISHRNLSLRSLKQSALSQ